MWLCENPTERFHQWFPQFRQQTIRQRLKVDGREDFQVQTLRIIEDGRARLQRTSLRSDENVMEVRQ